jgi:hypothetical protein
MRGQGHRRAHPGRDGRVEQQQRPGQHAELHVFDPAEIQVRTAARRTPEPAALAGRRPLRGVDLGVPGGRAQHRGKSELGHPPLCVLETVPAQWQVAT